MDVLVADDNEANRKLLRSYLSVQGFNVLEAHTGELAVEMYKKHQPDVVLMDIMMPGMGGYDAATAIKSCSSEDVYTPLIYVTAMKPEDAMTKALSAGGDDFVTKPIDFGILISKINAHLRIREAHQKLAEANKELRQYNQMLTRENELVEHIFKNALSMSFLDDRFIRYRITPASAFNGDILLVEKKPDGNVCVLLGDFTGHGLSAAIGTLPVVKVFFTMVRKGLAIEKIIQELNDTIKMLLPTNMFLCASLLELNISTRNMSVWAGGLPPMLLHDSKTGDVKEVKTQHMPLGILSSDEFESDTLSIDMADTQKLFLYTDGVTEAKNTLGEMYGVERLENIFKENQADPFEALIEDHRHYLGDSQQGDDMTLVELSCDQSLL